MQPIISAGGFALKLDITNENDIIDVVEHVIKIENKIDVLWNNAGFGLWGAVEDISIDRAKYQFDVNLFGRCVNHSFSRPAIHFQGLRT